MGTQETIPNNGLMKLTADEVHLPARHIEASRRHAQRSGRHEAGRTDYLGAGDGLRARRGPPAANADRSWRPVLIMVARTKPDGKFTVAFQRGGDVVDARTADTGERALKAAILILAEQDALEHGDRLTVTEA